MGGAGEHLYFYTLVVIALALNTTCVVICNVVVVDADNTLLTTYIVDLLIEQPLISH